MKKLFITGLMVAAMPCAVLQAEVIQTINFNPARLGQYERLKVSEKATFQGGLTAQSMQVRSGGTVSINESNSGALAYDIPLLDGRKGAQSDDVVNNFPAEPTLDFPGTCFSSLENCVGSNTTGNLNVKFNGGAASFKGPAGYNDPASRINQITTDANRLRLESVYATVKGKLNITGAGTYSFRNLNASTPLRLAGNWVPLPSTDGVGAKTLKWETRKTVKHPDKGGESVKILVLDGSGGGGKPPTCTPQACSAQPCPSGQTGQINYTWNQSQCKCVESSRTCQNASSGGGKYKLIATTGGQMLGMGSFTSGQTCPYSIKHRNDVSISACKGVGTTVREGDACTIIGQICYNGADCKIYGSGSGGAGWYPYTNIFECSK